MTLSAVITPMTEKTPIVTPNIVSTERSLLVFSAVSAMRMISWKFIAPHLALRATLSRRERACVRREPSPSGRGCREAAGEGASFVPQRLDRIESRCRERRRETREDSRKRRNDQTGKHETEREAHRKRWKCRGDTRGHQPRQRQSNHAANEANANRFHEEL